MIMMVLLVPAALLGLLLGMDRLERWTVARPAQTDTTTDAPTSG